MEGVTEFLERAKSLLGVGDVAGAYQVLVAAAVHEPSAEVWSLLGQALLNHYRRFDASVAAFRRVGDAGGYQGKVNLGWALHLAGRTEEGLGLLEEGVKGAPEDDWLGLMDLGQALLRLGRVDEAVEVSRRALGRAPDRADVQLSLAMALWAAGEWEEGFGWYEGRIGYMQRHFLSYPYPRWDGGHVGRLFLQAESGIGDAVMMHRWVGGAAERVDRVVLYVHEALRALMAENVPGNVEVWGLPRLMPPADAFCPLLSLPNAVGMAGEPRGEAYLRSERRVRGEGLLRVGIAWAGDPANVEGQWKTIPLAEWMPLVELPGVEVHSLQYVAGAEEIARVGLHGLVQDRLSAARDMAETQRVVEDMDLVVSSDSAVAHLCGALGVPVWLVRSEYAAPWIWPLREGGTPWYSSMRVWIRRRGEAWGVVMRRIAGELERMSR